MFLLFFLRVIFELLVMESCEGNNLQKISVLLLGLIPLQEKNLRCTCSVRTVYDPAFV